MKRFTIDEFQAWIKSHKVLDLAVDDIDSCGNHWITKVYEDNGKLYSIDFCNSYPSDCTELYDKEKKERGYCLREVKKKIRTIEQVYYVSIEEETNEEEF